jgi:hypothetical protein
MDQIMTTSVKDLRRMEENDRLEAAKASDQGWGLGTWLAVSAVVAGAGWAGYRTYTHQPIIPESVARKFRK